MVSMVASKGLLSGPYLCKMSVMRQAGPHLTLSSGFILWTWTLHQGPECPCPSDSHPDFTLEFLRFISKLTVIVVCAFLVMFSHCVCSDKKFK